MKKVAIVLLVVFVTALLALILIDKTTKKETVSSKERAKPTQALAKYKTQGNSEGSVIIEVTPLAISTKENVVFGVSMDTHSVELNKNLKEISLLVDDMGNEYKAISWDGGIGGHHLEGTLVFPKVNSEAKEVKLIIYGIAGINREFKWDL
ncbi:MAG: hypothetical protein Q7R31_02420 [Candidatus Levybacteria bacterium]|nr:hypothetical protein [Candidatus Levybacteria bacterium]